jgi:hypothetical protein
VVTGNQVSADVRLRVFVDALRVSMYVSRDVHGWLKQGELGIEDVPANWAECCRL